MEKSGKEEGLFAWGFRENARKEQGLRGILKEGCYLGRCCGMGAKNRIAHGQLLGLRCVSGGSRTEKGVERKIH